MAFQRQAVKIRQPRLSRTDMQAAHDALMEAFGHMPAHRPNRQAMQVEQYNTDAGGKGSFSHSTLGTKYWTRFLRK